MDPGEKILWQGRPDPSFHIDLSDTKSALMGVFFTAFSIFWMVMAAQGGGIFWLFGLPFFGIGVFMVIGVHFWKQSERKATHYTLTDKRAIIAKDLMGKRTLASYPIDESMELKLIDGTPGSIHFGRRTFSTRKGRTQSVPVGFDRIDEVREVYALMRAIQRGDE